MNKYYYLKKFSKKRLFYKKLVSSHILPNAKTVKIAIFVVGKNEDNKFIKHLAKKGAFS